ncbi:deoxyguanosinetriphosphate triphosphohydrolase [Alkalilimnicola ehrlichii MLHE-1]|uniref:Putative deoxyguanosinetriphosphate triphosphohydrolase n=1 Tax=Alkalilimnicola ehrlichii (strain ATCC BAA-1101 / DSM 17681 / MLHE-1) TaxID=187272 RepID=Q0A7B6_ALKEH|nr:deoxyguanosinetriphosphate triphosphohydrolase [Alkalilimnicola ehrlichii]ABI57271.1 putative deoxyguanosinetriphosphate triphosphohydrolase [Alkalilimnicola ehrlichii MLHE-1]
MEPEATSMDWERLLSKQRLGRPDEEGSLGFRTDFQRDFDRIVFSSAFRRLQDKTQVFPLAESDYVRTRLTHSLEVSCVGRSLGTRVGEAITRREGYTEVAPGDIGAIVAAACLAHDIGNPPFGHAGEDAIRHWVRTSPVARRALDELSPPQRAEFEHFEGNAQGFRVVTRLQNPDNRGGLQLTYATLGAALKYPCPAHAIDPGYGISRKKYGYFVAEADLFRAVAQTNGLLKQAPRTYCRHPLAFVMEAADNIAYLIVDFEDAFRLGILEYRTVHDHFRALLRGKDQGTVERRLARLRDDKERVEYLRARAINELVEASARAFMDHEAEIMTGRFERELTDTLPFSEALRAIAGVSQERIYDHLEVQGVCAAGYSVIGGLLDLFHEAVHDTAVALEEGKQAPPRSRTVTNLVPEQFLYQYDPDSGRRYRVTDPYLLLLNLTDFIAGMTDGYAVSLYKKLTGMALPHHG